MPRTAQSGTTSMTGVFQHLILRFRTRWLRGCALGFGQSTRLSEEAITRWAVTQRPISAGENGSCRRSLAA